MAIFRGTIRSAALAMDTALTVVLPYDRPAQQQLEPCKVIYLLHGLGDNCEAWTRYTAVERYARDKGLALIMPEVQRSFYYDMAMGMRYFTYITDELPKLSARMFGISRKREDSFIAGLSMGGYGALKCGFSRPDIYAACASFSGVVDIGYILRRDSIDDLQMGQIRALMGNELKVDPRDDVKYLAKSLLSIPSQKRPRVFMTCGTEDFLYEINIDMKDYLESLPLDFKYMEWPGEHEWDVWDKSIRYAIEYFLDK